MYNMYCTIYVQYELTVPGLIILYPITYTLRLVTLSFWSYFFYSSCVLFKYLLFHLFSFIFLLILFHSYIFLAFSFDLIFLSFLSCFSVFLLLFLSLSYYVFSFSLFDSLAHVLQSTYNVVIFRLFYFSPIIKAPLKDSHCRVSCAKNIQTKNVQLQKGWLQKLSNVDFHLLFPFFSFSFPLPKWSQKKERNLAQLFIQYLGQEDKKK